MVFVTGQKINDICCLIQQGRILEQRCVGSAKKIWARGKGEKSQSSSLHEHKDFDEKLVKRNLSRGNVFYQPAQNTHYFRSLKSEAPRMRLLAQVLVISLMRFSMNLG
jgi:hypothetical protein